MGNPLPGVHSHTLLKLTLTRSNRAIRLEPTSLAQPNPGKPISRLREIERRSRRRHLDDGGSVQNDIVRDGRIRLRFRNEDIGLSHRRVRDHRGDRIPLQRRRDGRGVQPANEDDEERRRERAFDAEREGDALGGGDPLRRRQSGEGLDRQRRVGAWALLDKGGRERVDGVEAEGGAVRVRGGDLAQVEALDGLVQGLGDEDGAGDAEVGLARDEAGAAQVGGDADALEHRGEADEGFGVGVGEAVGAGGDGFGAGGGEGGGEEFDVLFFIVGDVL